VAWLRSGSPRRPEETEDWFTKSEAAGRELDTDPYFIYIRDNIRTGNLL
jgi:hypothetical protein